MAIVSADQIAATRFIPEFVTDIGDPPGPPDWKKPQDYLASRAWTAVSFAQNPDPSADAQETR